MHNNFTKEGSASKVSQKCYPERIRSSNKSWERCKFYCKKLLNANSLAYIRRNETPLRIGKNRTHFLSFALITLKNMHKERTLYIRDTCISFRIDTPRFRRLAVRERSRATISLRYIISHSALTETFAPFLSTIGEGIYARALKTQRVPRTRTRTIPTSESTGV